jgi:hypothetical protein
LHQLRLGIETHPQQRQNAWRAGVDRAIEGGPRFIADETRGPKAFPVDTPFDFPQRGHDFVDACDNDGFAGILELPPAAGGGVLNQAAVQHEKNST